MAVTRDGMPIRCWTFPGNTADTGIIRRVREDLAGWNLHRMVWVADRGFASAANRAYLTRGGGHYIHAEKLRHTNTEAAAALARPGRYHTVAGNLRVKEVSRRSRRGRRRRRRGPRGAVRGLPQPRTSRPRRRRAGQPDHPPERADRRLRHLAYSPSRRAGRQPQDQARTAPLPAPHRGRAAAHRPRRRHTRGAPGRQWLLRTSDATLSAEDLRRLAACPSCSRVYARDTFAMVTAGVTGGKTVPATVAANPLLFVTLTAPSFGPVHTAHEDGRRCHPRSRETACAAWPARRAAWPCTRPGEELVGAPLCDECYDTASAVVWQWWAPELWRRFTIALRRSLARTLGVAESRLGAGGVGAVRQGRRVPAARAGALPRPDPPRRPRSRGHRRTRTAWTPPRSPEPFGRPCRVSRCSFPVSMTTTWRVGCVGAGRSMCGSCDRGSAPTTRPGR